MLTDISFQPIYDSSRCSIVNDLLLPALTNSLAYWRGVGYFSSGWLQLTAHGIEEIAKKGGKIYFIVSPVLSREDLEAFQIATDALKEQKVFDALRVSIDEIALNMQKDVLNTFAWLLADEIIEFKFAVPRPMTEGDYHDKVGVCVDTEDNLLAFHGSFNDTYKGSLNGEAFSVFQSWISGQDVYAYEHMRRLKDLWYNGNAQFSVHPFCETLKNKFIQLRNNERPYKLPDKEFCNAEEGVAEPYIPYTLKPYQNEAIKMWFENSCSGIFEMATGTGKTITSIAAAIKLYELQRKLFLIIVVPFTHLLEQWNENCQKFGIDSILCYGGNNKWRNEFKSLIMQFKIGYRKLACVIVVQNTACTEDFLCLAKKIPPRNFMMIADETHYLGAPNLQKALFQTATSRLGLSATPQRWMDKKGSDILYNYYGKVVYSISLEEAIAGGFLTRYLYYPVFVELTNEEVEEYSILSSDIGRLFVLIQEGNSDITLEEKLERLKLKRARLIARANNKLFAYEALLKRLHDTEHHLRDLLVFCADGTYRDVLHLTDANGIKSHEFVHEVNHKSRQQVLSAFAKGDIEAIISIKCMDEGVDVPSTKTAIFLASTTNPKQFIQRRGRVLRKYPGKDFAIIYDFVVVPPDGIDQIVASSILRRELPRFAEFADSADNKYEARELFWKKLEEYDMQMYIDTKPWDIYHKDMEEGEI